MLFFTLFNVSFSYQDHAKPNWLNLSMMSLKTWKSDILIIDLSKTFDKVSHYQHVLLRQGKVDDWI